VFGPPGPPGIRGQRPDFALCVVFVSDGGSSGTYRQVRAVVYLVLKTGKAVMSSWVRIPHPPLPWAVKAPLNRTHSAG